MTQELEVAICALQRSGHHAIMDWLMALLRGRFGKGSICYVNWVNQFMQHLDPFNTRTHPTDDSHKCTPGQRNCARKVLLYNFEDCGLYMMKSMEMYARDFNGNSIERQNILIIRDFYNLVASRMERTRKGRPLDHPYKALAGLWLEYADTYMEGSIYSEAIKNLMCINYNSWFTDEAYRKNIAACLKCPYTEETMGRVHLAGEGSSFTGTQGNARSLDVTGRWRKFKNDDEYISVVMHPAIQDWNGMIFGWYLDRQNGGELRMVPYKKE